jgi:hypothetical protein
MKEENPDEVSDDEYFTQKTYCKFDLKLDFKKEERKVFPFGFKIRNSQFSVVNGDHGSQLLLTSREGFVIYLRQHFMKYDFYNQDPKIVICFNCNDMTIYSAPPRVDLDRKVFWIGQHTTEAFDYQREDNSGYWVRHQSSEQTAANERRAKELESMNVELG